MKNNSILMFAFLIVFAFAADMASAQITINIPKIPKIPKIKKNKPQQPQPESSTTTDKSQSNDNQSGDNQTSEDSNTEKEPDKCETDGWLRLVVDEVTKMQKDIDTYTPDSGRLYYGSPTYDYLLISVSRAAKQQWQKDFKQNEVMNCPKMVSAFEKLSVSAAKKQPLVMPDKSVYPIQNPALEKMMKSKIDGLASHKILHTGIKQANWLIDKNDIGISTARYKHGRVWVRYVPDDHPYCRVYYINIIQDYAGGGTYGASYAKFVDEGLVGCPAGK